MPRPTPPPPLLLCINSVKTPVLVGYPGELKDNLWEYIGINIGNMVPQKGLKVTHSSTRTTK